MSRLSHIETVEHLRTVDLFRHCSAEQLMRLAAIASEERFEAGERLYSAGEPPEHLDCLIDGTVRLSAGGEELRLRPAPDSFGAGEILSDRLHRRDVEAYTHCQVLRFEADDFFDLLSNNIEIVKALFRRLLSPAAADGDGDAPG